MIRLPVNELGQRRPSFTHPDVPPPVAVGKCSKCQGNTRAEDYTSYTKEHGLRNMRTYRCIQHGTRCPSETVVVGEDNQEAIVAKNKAGSTPCIQTREWCDAQKAAIVKKHLAYRDVAKAAAVSASALAQGLNMHMSLSEATQGRIEQAIAGADPAVAQKVRKERASRKPKGYVDLAPASISAEAVGRALKAVVTAGMGDTVASPASETICYDVEPPKTGFIPPAKANDEPFHHSAVNAIGNALGDIKVPPFEETLDSLVRFGSITEEEAGKMADEETERLPVGSIERRLMGMASSYYDLVQRQKAVEVRVQSVAERAEERFTAMAQGHQLHENRLQRLDEDHARLESEVSTLDTSLSADIYRIETSLAGMQPLVVDAPTQEDRGDWSWRVVEATPPAPTPDELVSALSGYSDSQMAALMTAATARREMLKAMEAA